MQTRMPAADAFFLYVESPAALQQVGGLVLLEARGGAPDPAELATLVADRLGGLPRFRQRLQPGSRWRRPRWVDVPDLDWAWHVTGRDLPGGRPALHRLVAELQSEPLPRDRPLWRLVIVPEVEPDLAALVLVVHHVIADGIGLIRQALHLLDPAEDPAEDPVEDSAADATAGGRGAVRTGLAVAAGLVQLATDGWVRRRLPSGGDHRRRFGTADLPLARLRAVARRYRARVTDVLLSAVAGAVHRTRPDLAVGSRARLRTLVPLMLRAPDSPAEGNLTAAVLLDLPVGPCSEPDRLAEVVRRSRRLRTGTRALASRFVVQSVGELLPQPVYSWFARTVYGRRLFHAVVSNLPGPGGPLRLAGRELRAAYPIVPLAPGSPLAVGALGWHGVLHLGISTDPALLDDPDAFGAALLAIVDELAGG
jgi:WS/DGAT/MGAT family acyltransferase